VYHLILLWIMVDSVIIVVYFVQEEEKWNTCDFYNVWIRYIKQNSVLHWCTRNDFVLDNNMIKKKGSLCHTLFDHIFKKIQKEKIILKNVFFSKKYQNV
jgi:hypothetical protein